jgi:translation initiation factor IF-3
MAHTQASRPMMNEFAEKLSDIAQVDKPPKMEGRFMTMILTEKK